MSSGMSSGMSNGVRIKYPLVRLGTLKCNRNPCEYGLGPFDFYAAKSIKITLGDDTNVIKLTKMRCIVGWR